MQVYMQTGYLDNNRLDERKVFMQSEKTAKLI